MEQPPSESRVYNEIAGTSVHRLSGISDGIFAVGMTLLVLGLAVPAVDAVRTESDLTHELLKLAPSIVTYFMSFLTLGIFWVGQQMQLRCPSRRCCSPDSTGRGSRSSSSWLNILVMGTMLLIAAEYGLRAGLFPEAVRRTIGRLVRRRVYGAQALYLVAVLLSVFDTHLAIAAIVLIQLNFALAPGIPLLREI